MPLQVPVAANYQNPVNALRTIWDQPPPEGSRMIPVEIDWLGQGGPNSCIFINCAGQQPQNFSQICALSVDNSLCSSDIQFIFTDSQQTYTVAAYAPSSTFPVFTNSTSFYVDYLSTGAADTGDTTRFAVFNSMPPPVALPLSSEQQAVSNNTIAVATGNTTVIAATTAGYGTIEAISVTHQFDSAACNVAWQIKDSTSKVIASGQVAANANANVNNFQQSFNLSDLRVHFTGAVTFSQTITGSGTGSLACVNIYYRTP